MLIFTSMGDALLRFIVVGEIPGTDTQMGYRSSVIFASTVLVVTCTYLIFSKRRKVAKLLQAYQQPVNSIELITL
jgi:hypothetical protein